MTVEYNGIVANVLKVSAFELHESQDTIKAEKPMAILFVLECEIKTE